MFNKFFSASVYISWTISTCGSQVINNCVTCLIMVLENHFSQLDCSIFLWTFVFWLHCILSNQCPKGPDTRCNIARNIRHSTWLHGRNISCNITRNTWSAVTKLSCDDVYITQSKMASLSKKKALGVLALMLLDGEEKARIKRRNRRVWVRGWTLLVLKWGESLFRRHRFSLKL